MNMYTKICKKKCIFTFSGVLTELCDVKQQDGCNLDAKAFKGIFVRNLRYLVDATGSSNNIKGWEKIEQHWKSSSQLSFEKMAPFEYIFKVSYKYISS